MKFLLRFDEIYSGGTNLSRVSGENLSVHRAKISRINERRIPAFREAAARGLPIDIDVGCRYANFTYDYARATGRHVIGIDPDRRAVQIFAEGPPTWAAMAELIRSGMVPAECEDIYADRNDVLLLPLAAEDLLGCEEFSWLRGRIHRIFLNMPYRELSVSEVVKLFSAGTNGQGELHVMTEFSTLLHGIETRMSFLSSKIPYDPVAVQIATVDRLIVERLCDFVDISWRGFIRE